MTPRSLPTLLVVAACLLAGCTAPGDSGPGGATDGTDGGAGDGGPSDGHHGDDGHHHGDGGHGTGTDDNSTDGSDGLDDDTPEIAPPDEQFQSDPDDVDRPGEYALLPKAEGHGDERWDVPTWNLGARWEFRLDVTGTTCDPETHDEVVGTGASWNQSVYNLRHTSFHCETGEQTGTRDTNKTQAHLNTLDDDGYIAHDLLFPLEDGKRWVYMASNGRKVTAEATHDPAYLWNITLIEAWHVSLSFEGDGNVSIEQWIGVEAKNLVRKEIWADNAEGVSGIVLATDLLEYSE